MTRILTIAALSVALIAGGGLWLMNRGATPADGGFALPGAASAQSSGEAADVEIIEMVKGAEDAPVEIIEYASFTCPHCATFHENVLPRLTEDYIDTGKVRFVYREVYFDKYGMWASMIARCEPQRFFGISDLVYKGQSAWMRAGGDGAIANELRKIGLLAGLDQQTLDSCLQDGAKLRGLVEWYRANAEEHGIQATPSLVIDGQTYSNMSYDKLRGIIDEKLPQ